MTTPEQRLEDLGYRLSDAPPPLGEYVRTVRTGDLVYTAGHGPFSETGETAMRGQVGGELTFDQGQEAARLCAVACLSSLKTELGDLRRIRRVVKMLAFVNCAPGFDDTSGVVDGASRLLNQVLGEPGVHARAAIGTSVLPKRIPVELELVVEIGEAVP
jgi:enamine deaminase RidA (YjgF/YER057c/UK114 family)